MGENDGNNGGDPAAVKKAYRNLFGWALFARIFVAVSIFGGSAALAERLGLTHSDKPDILTVYLIYLLAGVIYGLQTGLRNFRIGRLLASGLLAWMAVDIFTTVPACLAFLLAPMLLVTVIAGLVLRYPQPPEPPQV